MLPLVLPSLLPILVALVLALLVPNRLTYHRIRDSKPCLHGESVVRSAGMWPEKLFAIGGGQMASPCSTVRIMEGNDRMCRPATASRSRCLSLVVSGGRMSRRLVRVELVTMTSADAAGIEGRQDGRGASYWSASTASRVRRSVLWRRGVGWPRRRPLPGRRHAWRR